MTGEAEFLNRLAEIDAIIIRAESSVCMAERMLRELCQDHAEVCSIPGLLFTGRGFFIRAHDELGVVYDAIKDGDA